MKKYSLAAIAGVAILSAIPAFADNATFQFNETCSGGTSSGDCSQQSTNSGNFGNSYKFYSAFATSGTAVNATAYAFSNATTTTTNGTTFQTGEVGQYAGTASVQGEETNPVTIPLGLGDCNQYEGLSCTSPQHQVDNNVGYDFILVEFSAAVDLNSLVLSTYQGSSNTADSQNFSYIAGNAALGTSPVTAGTTISTLLGTNGASMNQVSCTNMSNEDCSTGASNSYSLTGGTGVNDVTWMLIAAQYTDSGSSDYFKISSLGVTNYSGTTGSGGSTPEPATFGMIGLALAGLGIYGRKRKSGNS